MQLGERIAHRSPFGGQTVNMKKYQEALMSLEQLHWHLHLNGGPGLLDCRATAQVQRGVAP